MNIGLLSDTHGYLDPKILDHFADCDEIWHAGDIGDPLVMDALSAQKKVRAVFGNIDDREMQIRFREDLRFRCEGLNIWITHIAGSPPKYNSRVKKELANGAPDILICGHSHILRVGRDPVYNNMLYINPGAAGNHGFHTMRTAIRFTIENGSVVKMDVIELGKRGVPDQKR